MGHVTFCLSVEDEMNAFCRDGGGTVGFSEFLAIMQRTTLHKLGRYELEFVKSTLPGKCLLTWRAALFNFTLEESKNAV